MVCNAGEEGGGSLGGRGEDGLVGEMEDGDGDRGWGPTSG